MAKKSKSAFNATWFENASEQQGYWYASELQQSLGYADEKESFQETMDLAKEVLKELGLSAQQHIANYPRRQGRGAPVADVKLSRFGCYLMIMLADDEKKEVKDAIPYFMKLAREAETNFFPAPEEIERLRLRGRVKEKVVELNSLLHDRGVDMPPEYARVANAGYVGLYGETAQEIRDHMNAGIPSYATPLDWMGLRDLELNLCKLEDTIDRIERRDLWGTESLEAAAWWVGARTADKYGAEMEGAEPKIGEIEKALKKICEHFETKNPRMKPAHTR